jgi:hypothetical protein
MPASRTPRLSLACDIRSLPLDPREAFLLSRIDGICSEAELALLTGLELLSVRTSIDRLISLGAVQVDERMVESPISAPRLPVAPPYIPPPAVEDDGSDLDPEHRRRVRELSARLDDLDHYQLLGVPETADRKEIKKAYYELAPQFHPDRFFGKRLGSYKAQMEAIFGRLTIAYEAISTRERREEYDAYLATQKQTRAMEQALDSGAELPRGDSPRPGPVRSISGVTLSPVAIREGAPVASAAAGGATRAGEVTPPPVAASTPPSASVSLPPPVASAAPSVSVPPRSISPPPSISQPPRSISPPPRSISAPTGPVVPSIPPSPSSATVRTSEEERARRAALARKLSASKLGGSSAPPVPAAGSSGPSVSPPPSIGATAALEDLKRRREAVTADGKRHQVRRYVDAAQQALAANNYAAAANAYRLARSLDPDDPELAAATERTTKAAAGALASGYLKQGEYEQREGRLQDAARSFTKAAAGMPQSAEVHEKAARAIVRARGDLHQAVDLGRRAVALEPKRLSARLVLAEVYIAAGLDLAARRELDAARQLGPHDGRIQELAKLLR